MPYDNSAQRQVHPDKVACDANEAFRVFCNQPPGKQNVYAVAKAMRVPVQKIGQIAQRDEWYKRIKAISAGVHEKLDRDIVDEQAEANQRHLAAARKLLERAVEAMETMQIERPADVIQAVAKAVEVERLCLGASTKNIDVSLDEKIQGYYQRWLTDRAKDAEFDQIEGEPPGVPELEAGEDGEPGSAAP